MALARKEIGTGWDRNNRNAMNDNFEELFDGFTNVVEVVSEKAYGDVIDAAKLKWGEPVGAQTDLPSSAQEGDTRMARDTGKVYRYNGSSWVEIQQIDAGPVNEVDSRLTSQLAQKAQQEDLEATDESVTNLRLIKADKSDLSQKMNREESFSVTQIDKNKGKLDETYMSEEFIAQFVENTQPIHTVPADNTITSNKLVEGAVTSNKASGLSLTPVVSLGSGTTVKPDLNLQNNTLTFDNTFFILIGKRRFTVSANVVDLTPAFTDSSAAIVLFNENTRNLRAIRQSQYNNISESEVVLATIFKDSNGNLIGLSTVFDLTIGGVDSSVYFIKENGIAAHKVMPQGSFPIITLGNGIAPPNFNQKNKTLTFGSFNIFYRNKRYFIQGGHVFDFNAFSSAGVAVYFNPTTNNFSVRDQTGLGGLSNDAILIFVATFRDGYYLERLHINCDYTIDGKPLYMPYSENGQGRVGDYVLSIEKLIGDFPITNYLGVGDEGSPFQESVIDYSVVYDLFDELVTKFPNYVAREQIGLSTNDIPIYLYKFEPEIAQVPNVQIKPYPKIILDSSIHGGESIATYTLYYLLKSICDDWQENEAMEYMRHYVNFYVVPLPNPEDFSSGEYVGIDNINLNRDFDVNWREQTGSGTAPNQRVESVVMSDFLENHRDALTFIDCHVRGNSVSSDNALMWMDNGNSDSLDLVHKATIEKMTRKWKTEFPSLANVKGMLGYVTKTTTPGSGTVRSYADNVLGMKALLWEGFKSSPTVNDYEGEQVINMNVRYLGETVMSVIKNYQ